jgi:endonuclease YncB( thermonuclease family)
MRTLKVAFLICLSALCLSLSAARYHKVHFVYDGDTVLLDNKKKVRYLGINAPEINHEGGNSEFMAHAAQNLNRELVAKTWIRLEYDQERKDRYGRLLAYVFLRNGEMVNALLVSRGMAHVLLNKLGLKYQDLLVNCQRKAMKEKSGMWSRPLKGNETFYVGNRHSYRFHRPECSFAKEIAPKNAVRFHSLYDAFWAGYSPCKRCRP